ncbi:hypothetical protein MYW48_10850 [Bacillus cereus]|uniref:hypothetical protein n=1 Tax=Bacillus cereus TaxID=1396 RepID=UPI001FFCAEC7|nr:hypothetical protein [Bacillus cereus]UPJ18526.1 hypothetical protein MYW48_10850 [Bacillus cereus]
MDGTQRRETVLYTDTEKRTDKIERIPWGSKADGKSIEEISYTKMRTTAVLSKTKSLINKEFIHISCVLF